ncbi:YadA-like family protein, partial [Inquilinus sp. NPDC058860]|uniref:YadA-like family protein n=1 Tax=Inquilinus sp. NPDC058860 TaxID=3346652 RepID=UPI003691F86E
STVSVGAVGAERTITNVAAGRIAVDSTDAVNGSQLFATNTSVDTLNTKVDNITNGGGIKYFHATSTLADSQATGTDSTAAGPEAVASVTDGVAVGHGATAGANAGDVALGSGSTTAAVVGTTSTTIAGTTYNFAGTTPTSTVSVGAAGAERTITNVAAGRIAIDSTDAVNGSQLFATNTSVDTLNTKVDNISNGGGIKYFHATSTLADSQATGTDSTAAGPEAVASVTDGVAVGHGATAGANVGDVALGSGSTTATVVATPSTTIAGTTYNFAGTTPTSTVSVGAPGAERTITNVAAGRIAVDSTDAVNGSQLFATNTSVDTLNTKVDNISTGGGIKYFHATSTLADSQATGTDSTAAGPEAVASVTDGVAIGHGATAGANVGDVALGSGSTTATAVGTASTTIAGTTYNFAGTTPTSTVSVGAVGAERTITNVAAGRIAINSTDAVNGSQLFATNTSVDTLNTKVDNITNGGGIKYFHATSTLADSQATGTDSVAVGPTAVASVQDGIAIGHGAAAGANVGDVALGAGSTTETVVATAAATIAGKAYSFAGATPTSTVSVGAVGAERTITNVAAGRLSETSTDAINGSQLFATNTAVNILGIQIGNGGIGPVQYSNPDTPTTPNGGVPTFDLTLVGKGSGPVTLHNVAPGLVSKTSTDAINGSQLYGVSQSITNVLGGDSKVNPDGTITGPTFNIQGGSYTTITEAFGAVDGSLTTINNQLDSISNGGGIKYFHANSKLADSQAVGANSVAIGPASTAGGIDSFAAGNGATTAAGATGAVALGSASSAGASGATALGQGATATNANDVALGAGSKTAAAVGTSGASFNNFNLTGFAGANPTSTVSVGDVGAERTITNVAAGRITKDSTDAINGSQMFALATAVDSSISGGAGIKYFHTNSTLADSSPTGTNSTAIGPASTASASNAISMGNGASASANNAIAIGAGAQATKANSLALGAGSTTLANLSDAAYKPVVGATVAGVATGEVSVGSSGAERRITNVAAGSAATDAANISQLQALSSLSVKYDTDGSGNLTNRITLQGGNQGAPVTIGNVAPGVAGTDAVNVDQLNGAFDSLNGKIKQARRDAWQGAAIGIAASSLQFDPRPGKVSAAIGGGMWHEQGALALGLGYTAESGRVRLNARAVTSGDDWGGGIGVSFTFN